MPKKKYVEDTIKVVDNLIKIRPDLKNEREELIDIMLTKSYITNEIKLLEKFEFNNQIYYRDKNKKYIYQNSLYNNKNISSIVGLYEYVNSEFIYYFFDEMSNSLLNKKYLFSKEEINEFNI